MHRSRCRSVALISTTILALTCASLVASPQDERKKVQVYILAGQSNMEGKGFPEPIAYQVTQAKYRDRYAHFIKGKDFASFAKILNASIWSEYP